MTAFTAVSYTPVKGHTTTPKASWFLMMSPPAPVWVGRKGTPRAAAFRARVIVKFECSCSSNGRGIPPLYSATEVIAHTRTDIADPSGNHFLYTPSTDQFVKENI